MENKKDFTRKRLIDILREEVEIIKVMTGELKKGGKGKGESGI